MSEPGKFVRLNQVNQSNKVKKKSKKKNKIKLNEKQTKDFKQTVVKKKQHAPKSALPVPEKKFHAQPKKKNSASKKDFQGNLVDQLKASRFRFINEQLYTHTGNEAIDIFSEDPVAFSTYHEGYRQQVEQWPLNPLDRIIKSVKALPGHFVVADFGCGDGRLAKSISQKCYSLDLVAANDSVIACDMAHTPLQSNSINVAVFCLSLMGTNLKDFLLEANRVLKTGGHLKIAEIESRFDNVNAFIQHLQTCGFQLISKDISTKIFYFLYFKKVRDVSNPKEVKDFALKPCMYKKR